jgi:hypothetical protein
MPPEVREGRLMMSTKAVVNIKKVEDECGKIREESVQVWKNLMGYLEIKAIEAKLREAQEQVHKEVEKVATLPPVECMESILAQWKACVEVERLRDQQNILQ